MDELDRVRTNPASEDRALQRTLESLRPSRSEVLSAVRVEAIAQRAASAARVAPSRSFLDGIVRSHSARTVLASTVLLVGVMSAGAAGMLPEPIQRGFDRLAEVVGLDRGGDDGVGPASDAGASDDPAGGSEGATAPGSGDPDGADATAPSEGSSTDEGSGASPPTAATGETPRPPEQARAPARMLGPPPHAGQPGPPPHAGQPGRPPHATEPGRPPHAGQPGPPPPAPGPPEHPAPPPQAGEQGRPPQAEGRAGDGLDPRG